MATAVAVLTDSGRLGRILRALEQGSEELSHRQFCEALAAPEDGWEDLSYGKLAEKLRRMNGPAK